MNTNKETVNKLEQARADQARRGLSMFYSPDGELYQTDLALRFNHGVKERCDGLGEISYVCLCNREQKWGWRHISNSSNIALINAWEWFIYNATEPKERSYYGYIKKNITSNYWYADIVDIDTWESVSTFRRFPSVIQALDWAEKYVSEIGGTISWNPKKL